MEGVAGTVNIIYSFRLKKCMGVKNDRTGRGEQIRRRPRIAVYPGTFDPFHNGHLDVVLYAASIFDGIYIALGRNWRKNTLVDTKTRVELISSALEEAVKDDSIRKRLKVTSFDGLLVDYAERTSAQHIIRGARRSREWRR